MPIRILVVDDELDMQELIKWRFRRAIRNNLYEFSYTFSGLEALKLLTSDPDIDILLLDINMPEMNGLTLLEKLKEHPLLIKTIMVTAYENMENIRAAMNGGAFDFVTKPIDIPDLEKTIQKAYEELSQLRKGAEAQRQLPITQQALEETDEKARYLEELDELKSRFFTNISHEFRTPLTVIGGMVDQMLAQPDRWLQKGHRMIRRNTDQLLDLVNQILDLRKLEAGQLPLHLEQLELVSFLRYLIESFHALAVDKKIDLSFHSSVEELWMDIDAEKLLRILGNLLSNALKFTQTGGKIDVQLAVHRQEQDPSDPSAVLTVSDTGIGIPKDRLPKIFDRFYQVDSSITRKQEGTGIGLALCKELLSLMGGDIQVESEVGKGTSFQLSIPIQQSMDKVVKELKPSLPSSLLHADKRREEQPSEVEQTLEAEQASLLIIEDNPDVVEYLTACLEDQYQLLIANDGKDGIETALEQVPDLIISDVMMPEKDGFEVCDTLKRDIRTSHIPIILLTAKADERSRLQGLKKGADAYLAKPFNQEELFVRLAKLLEIRQTLQARYGEQAEADLSLSEDFEQEDEFLHSIREAVESNLPDTFDIPALCLHLGLSRTNLHRKIKALTGVSTTIYTRRLRLKKAQELLKNSDLTVAEVAYEVGFNDPGYFARSFLQEFGMSPKKFR